MTGVGWKGIRERINARLGDLTTWGDRVQLNRYIERINSAYILRTLPDAVIECSGEGISWLTLAPRVTGADLRTLVRIMPTTSSPNSGFLSLHTRQREWDAISSDLLRADLDRDEVWGDLELQLNEELNDEGAIANWVDHTLLSDVDALRTRIATTVDFDYPEHEKRPVPTDRYWADQVVRQLLDEYADRITAELYWNQPALIEV